MNRNKRILLVAVIGIIALLLTCCIGTVTEHGQNTETHEAAYSNTTALTFRNAKLLNEHYEKHGKDMGFGSAKEYEKAAAAVVSRALHKTESEDGDDVYYIKATNEFVIVSTDGYIRTYFKPDSGIKYFNKQ